MAACVNSVYVMHIQVLARSLDSYVYRATKVVGMTITRDYMNWVAIMLLKLVVQFILSIVYSCLCL